MTCGSPTCTALAQFMRLGEIYNLPPATYKIPKRPWDSRSQDVISGWTAFKIPGIAAATAAASAQKTSTWSAMNP